MVTRLNDILVTEQYWYLDMRGNNHIVFAKSQSVADRYARAMGYNLKRAEKPNNISPVTIHNTNGWYERLLVPEYRD